MTDRQKLSLLTKEQLVDGILAFKNRTLISHLESEVVDIYYKKLEKISNAQSMVDFKTIEGLKTYQRLQAEYERTQTVFDKLCEVDK